MAAVFKGNDYLPLKFASVSFYCQVSDTGSVGWASSLDTYKSSIWFRPENSSFHFEDSQTLKLNSIADNLSIYTEPGSEHLNALQNINFGLVGFMVFNATFNNISVI